MFTSKKLRPNFDPKSVFENVLDGLCFQCSSMYIRNQMVNKHMSDKCRDCVNFKQKLLKMCSRHEKKLMWKLDCGHPCLNDTTLNLCYFGTIKLIGHPPFVEHIIAVIKERYFREISVEGDPVNMCTKLRISLDPTNEKVQCTVVVLNGLYSIDTIFNEPSEIFRIVAINPREALSHFVHMMTFLYCKSLLC